MEKVLSVLVGGITRVLPVQACNANTLGMTAILGIHDLTPTAPYTFGDFY